MSDSDLYGTSAVAELPITASPSAAKLRPVVVEDHRQIAAVQQRNGLGSKSPEQWRHLWLENPIYKKIRDWPMGHVAVRPDGEVVGYMGNIPAGFSFQGNDLVCGCTHAMVMDPPQRGHAGFFVKRLLSNKLADFNIATSANPNSSRFAEPMRCSKVPVGNWNHSVYWITNYRGFTTSAFAMKKWPQLLAYPAAAAMAARDKLTKDGIRALRTQPTLTACSGFDERFDVFWDELKRIYPNRLLADRSRQMLQWHFHYALIQKRVWILTTEKGSRISSYGIFYRHDNPSLGLKRVRLIDFQTLDNDAQSLASMLGWAYQRCQKENIHMLEAYGFRPDKEAIIKSLGPHRRQLPTWFYFYYTRNKEFAPILRDPEIWDPCHYDGDSSL